MHLSTSHLTQVVFSVLLSSTASMALSVSSRATVCNGHAELCDRSFGNVTFVGAHDSYAVSSSNIAANQDYDVTQQLNDGIRMLQMQAHNQSGVIQLCHTTCSLLNGGTLESYLGKVKTWLDSNPNDVVSLLIVNSDDMAPSEYDTVFKAASLDTMSYSPPSSSLTASQWPTLGTLIDAGTPLVTFLTTEADFTSVAYLIDEFSNVWETAFDVTDTTFNCEVNRTTGDTSTQLYLINHFLDELIASFPVPDKSSAASTNAVSGVGSLGVQVETCAAEYGRDPNFMLVDFYEYGNGSVFEVAATANGVTYSPTSAVATPISSDSTTSSSTSGLPRLSPNVVGASLAMVTGIMIGIWSIV